MPNSGYAVTDHAAQGRTVHTALAVITGTEDRQHVYVALTRGTDANHAYVFTASPKRSDPMPGPRPAPELARYDKIYAKRANVSAPATAPAEPGTALSVLAAVLDHDGQQHSASQTRSQALADADHLALLHAIWTAETTSAREQRYRKLLAAALPGYHAEPGPRDRWLWRTLHGAELAGLDPAQILADAIGERDLTGARDILTVIDARIRNRTGTFVPLMAGPWSARVPAIADPERRAYVTQVAGLMDARMERLGEHAADSAPPWAVSALGRVPEHQAARLDWQRRAAAIAAWRELSGYHHPADPIGPEPAAAAPDLRAAWHEALAALGPVGGPDVRGMPDGLLLHLRDTYPIETAWAPQYVGGRTPPDPRRRLGRPPDQPARRHRRPRRPPARRPPPGHPGTGACPQLSRLGSGLPAARDRLRRSHGRPDGVGRRDPAATAASCGCRRRGAPPSPRPVLRTVAVGRARTRHRRPARQAHTDCRRTVHRDGPVDQGPRRGAPDLRRPARRPAEPDHPVRGPRLRRPRPGVPRLVRAAKGRDLAAS